MAPAERPHAAKNCAFPGRTTQTRLCLWQFCCNKCCNIASTTTFGCRPCPQTPVSRAPNDHTRRHPRREHDDDDPLSRARPATARGPRRSSAASRGRA
jgi:hypothetical protein